MCMPCGLYTIAGLLFKYQNYSKICSQVLISRLINSHLSLFILFSSLFLFHFNNICELQLLFTFYTFNIINKNFDYAIEYITFHSL